MVYTSKIVLSCPLMLLCFPPCAGPPAGSGGLPRSGLNGDIWTSDKAAVDHHGR